MGGIHAKDRFPHSAQCTGKFIDIAVGRHIACLEMHLGDALVISFDKAKENLGVDPASVFVDMPHDAEIIGDDITVGRDLQVALMHIGMEIAITQGMAQKQRQYPFSQNGAVMAGRIQCSIVAEWQPVGPAECHHATGGVIPQDLGQLKTLVILGIGGKFGCSGAFQSQVQFALHNAVEMLDHIHRLKPPRTGGKEIGNPCCEIEGIHILAEGAFNAGAQHFYGNLLVGVPQPCAMHLRNRRGGNGFAELRIDLINRLSEFLFDLCHRLGAGKWGQLVL